MPQPENISRWRNNSIENSETEIPAGPVLDKLARYSVNARALKKWSQERLHLEISTDGVVTARFRYEGTTCSNFGRSIHYDYHVRLRPRAEAYRIAELSCAPSGDDSGHAHQCEFIKDPDGFMNRLASEKPLVGCPLNDVLAWKRAANPAGCFCEADSREHKWGMIFEVIHFALAQKGAA